MSSNDQPGVAIIHFKLKYNENTVAKNNFLVAKCVSISQTARQCHWVLSKSFKHTSTTQMQMTVMYERNLYLVSLSGDI